MSKKTSWTEEQLIDAVKACSSYRQVIRSLGLIPAGGNYVQVQYAIRRLELDVSHFKGKGWNKGLRYSLPQIRKQLDELLINDSHTQSHKLRLRLIEEGLKQPECELCGWCKVSDDGRLPLELDHINGNRYDNRIENLRILCPNCHSLQPTHRGRNKKVALRKLTN